MLDRWRTEQRMIKRFKGFVEDAPPLPDAKAALFESYSKQVGHLQNLLSLVSTLPGEHRPPVGEWDDLLGPLLRILFQKGADIDRYTLALLWRPVLLEEGEVDRFVRATVSAAASARNFYHYDEALSLCREGREAARGRECPVLPYLVNLQGFVHALALDFSSARSCFEEALTLAEGTDDGLLKRWGGLDGRAFIAQERYNLLDSLLHEGYYSEGSRLQALLGEAQVLLESLSESSPGSEFSPLLVQSRAEIALLQGKAKEAKKTLRRLYEETDAEGPYRFSMKAMQGRVLSVAAGREGDWQEAYRWIRQALSKGLRHCYPAEEQFVLTQAISVLRNLHGKGTDDDRRELIRDLVRLLEDKDWYTGGSHARRVSALAVKIGRRLKATGGWSIDLERLEVAGLLHDIGKLRIPWSLLNKIVSITPAERRLLEEHAAHGGEILREIGMDVEAAIVEQHHEKADGSGYPTGKPPDRLAAIIGVCDVYEAAVTPNRRYKEPKSKVTALAEITVSAGRQYDAQVVHALLETVEEESVGVPFAGGPPLGRR